MPKAGIQARRSTNWKAGADAEASKPAHSASVTPKVRSDTSSVRLRMSPSFEPSRFDRNMSSTAPAMGNAMRMESSPVTSRYLQR